MAEAETVAATDKKQRERSSIEFPYGDLDDAVEVARAIHSNSGGECTLDQLAAWLKYSGVGGGAFRLKVATARVFGLVETDRQGLTLTELGRVIVDSQRERESRAEAFLHVPLYRAIYDKYRGHLLPPDVGLEREMANLGVAEKQKDKARQAFRRSAEQAGFFDQGKDRLVMPARVATRAIDEPAPPPADEPRRNGGSGGEPPKRHPFIEGLLERLPAPDTEWAMEDRDQWLETAKNIFGLIYKAPKSPPKPAELHPN